MYDSATITRIASCDVEVGTFVWYKGLTGSGGHWDCPAVICEAYQEAGQFRLMSLDDMTKQNQTYYVDRKINPSYSQDHMRLASVEEVDVYLVARGSDKNACQIRAEVQATAEVSRPEHIPMGRGMWPV